MYRRLTREELEDLQQPFVRFLAAQGIPAEDWLKIKVTDEARADLLVDQFSEMVHADVLARATHLEQREATQLLAYRCTGPRLELRGLIVEGAQAFDFRQNLPPEAMLAAVKASGARVRLASAERDYRPSREQDLFHMLEAGAKLASSAAMFDLLDQLCSTNSSLGR